MSPWLLLIAGLARAAPSDATIVYYNSRMALQEDAPLESVKLWLLRNSLEGMTGRVSPHDADFRSVTWASLGELGLCTDGLRKDRDGAGLWPLATHNLIVRTMGRRQGEPLPRTFDAFDVGLQSREVAIGDALDAESLATVRLRRGRCLAPRVAAVRAGQSPFKKAATRASITRVLRDLLEKALESLAPDTVQGRSVIEARIFDLDLVIAGIAEREARKRAQAKARRARALGLSRETTEVMSASAPTTTLSEDSRAARILHGAASWPASEWMALESERRRYLFDRARNHGVDEAALQAVALAVLDAHIAAGDGAEVQAWIPRAAPTAAMQSEIWSGDRGVAILALGPDAGFRERAAISLHRGVDDLARGDLESALRAFAFALSEAHEATDPDAVASLSRRWLSHVAGRFELDEELVATLRVLVPGRDFSVLLEDLMWRAAFHADIESFEMGEAALPGRSALNRRLEALRPLAAGDAADFTRGVHGGLDRSPSETLRLLTQLVERLEREDAETRRRQIPLLTALRARLRPLSEDPDASTRQRLTAQTLRGRMQSMLEGLGIVGDDAPDRARSVDPTAEVFVGSIRLAPSDPLPWPFPLTDAARPGVYSPIRLRPAEWTDAAGATVFGWGIEG